MRTRDRHREPHALRLPARQSPGAPLGQIGQPGQLQHLVQRHRVGVQAPHEPDDLPDGQVRDQFAVLEHRADEPGGGGLGRGLPEHLDPPRVRFDEAEHHADRGALPGPVRPEHRHDLPGGHPQAQRLDGPHVPVALGHALNADRFHVLNVRNDQLTVLVNVVVPSG
jgi:hypothetical protein